MPTKNQQELLKFLGPEYSMKTIDLEPCIYRKLNNRYDIEISGTARKKQEIVVYLWDISKVEKQREFIVEQHSKIFNKETLKSVLDKIITTYSDLI